MRMLLLMFMSVLTYSGLVVGSNAGGAQQKENQCIAIRWWLECLYD
jgi:hypothetical protein